MKKYRLETTTSNNCPFIMLTVRDGKDEVHMVFPPRKTLKGAINVARKFTDKFGLKDIDWNSIREF